MGTTMLRDLNEIHDPHLYLPIRGKTYKIPAPSRAEHQRIKDEVVHNFDLSTEDQYAECEKVLGPALAEMEADDLPNPWIVHAGLTALMHFGISPTFGALQWNGTLDKAGELAEQLKAQVEALNV